MLFSIIMESVGDEAISLYRPTSVLFLPETQPTEAAFDFDGFVALGKST